MNQIRFLLISLTALLVIGCVPSPAAATNITPIPDNPTETKSTENLQRMDEQGAVTVEATPLNLNSVGETLDFQIAMNTHSVDLSMDLAALSTLTTDTGKTVQASVWGGEPGGHHVSGTLSFPATVDGKSLLEGAKTLTLTIRDVDAAERTFQWDLEPK